MMQRSTYHGSGGRTVLLCVLLALAGAAVGNELECGPLELPGQFGPWDYANPAHRGNQLYLVEKAHFTREVETLSAGVSGHIGGDLDYTLRAFPNHHRALRTLIEYYTGPVRRPPLRYSAECYFDRAVRMNASDPSVWLLFGMYKQRVNDYEAAEDYYDRAALLGREQPEVNYNLGLMYLSLNMPIKALHHAKIAYEGGYPLPGLMQKLKQKGVWEASK